jgi:hypothetical protein
MFVEKSISTGNGIEPEKAIRYFVGNPEMRIADICRATGVSTSTLYRLFPESVFA